MSQVKVFKMSKYQESPEQFEKRINEWIDTVGDIALLSAGENAHNGDVVLTLQSFGEKKSVSQELCVFGWADIDTLEHAVNSALYDLSESARYGKDINFVTTSKSARALAVFIVEGNRPYPSSGPELSDVTTEIPEEKKQDQVVNAKPKRGRKPKIVT